MSSDDSAVDGAQQFPIDVDFENYAMEKERAEKLRSELQTLKSRSWLVDLIEWVDEVGVVEAPEGQSDILIEQKIKVLRWTEDAELQSCTLHYNDLDLEIRVAAELILALQKLPKGDEFLLTFVHPQMLEKLVIIEEALHAALKAHHKIKADKAKAFQERMSKFNT